MPPDGRTGPHVDPPPEFRGLFRQDRMARELYSEGAGIARTLPAAVAVPADRDDVAPLVRWARRQGHTLIPRGSGSGMAAGAVGPGVIVDLSRLTSMEPVDRDASRVGAGAGALRGTVDAAARAHGLRFPVDPSSGAFCTIGGMAGTNAAGARTLRYGATKQWVVGLRCIFDDGSAAWLRRGEPLPAGIPALDRLATTLRALGQQLHVPLRHTGVIKESSGYDISRALAPDGHLIDLLIGSEGTLALFTDVELALCPVPGATATVLATFGSLDHAAACATGAREAGASACELLDRTYIEIAERDGPTGIPGGVEAVLLIETEGANAEEAAYHAERIAVICRLHRASETVIASDGDAERKLWALRHAASPTLARLAPRLRSMQFIEDGCVPPANFAAYVRGVREALARFDTPGVIFGHAGDAHAHVNPLIDTTRADWRDRVRGILDEVCDLTATLGGTLAGEHGDGRLRAPLLQRVWSTEARAAFMNVKDAADPAGVFNGGCKIAQAGDDPLASIRHDPAAPALDPLARAVLDGIERDRAWHRFRLGAAERVEARG